MICYTPSTYTTYAYSILYKRTPLRLTAPSFFKQHRVLNLQRWLNWVLPKLYCTTFQCVMLCSCRTHMRLCTRHNNSTQQESLTQHLTKQLSYYISYVNITTVPDLPLSTQIIWQLPNCYRSLHEVIVIFGIFCEARYNCVIHNLTVYHIVHSR